MAVHFHQGQAMEGQEGLVMVLLIMFGIVELQLMVIICFLLILAVVGLIGAWGLLFLVAVVVAVLLFILIIFYWKEEYLTHSFYSFFLSIHFFYHFYSLLYVLVM